MSPLNNGAAHRMAVDEQGAHVVLPLAHGWETVGKTPGSLPWLRPDFFPTAKLPKVLDEKPPLIEP